MQTLVLLIWLDLGGFLDVKINITFIVFQGSIRKKKNIIIIIDPTGYGMTAAFSEGLYEGSGWCFFYISEKTLKRDTLSDC